MTRSTPVELSVILPAYNEGPAVVNAIEKYVRALEGCCSGFEILVINDGSKDDTLVFAEKTAQSCPAVRVLNNPRNLGQAATVLRGLTESLGEVVMHNGIDLPFDPTETPRVLEKIREGADVVVVERNNREAYGWVRKIISWCNIALVKILLHSPFTDHNFVQAYRRQVVQSIVVESRGLATVTPELILKAQAEGFRVERLGARYRGRISGKSTVTLKRIVHTFVELLRLWAIMRRARAVARSRSIERGNHG